MREVTEPLAAGAHASAAADSIGPAAETFIYGIAKFMSGVDEGVTAIFRHGWRDGQWDGADDEVIEEAPLQVQIGGVPYAVIMRTPGHDDEFVRGFLWTEGVIPAISAIRSARHCTQAGSDAAEHVMQVVLHDGADLLQPPRRHLVVNASCGMCGRAQVDEMLALLQPLAKIMPTMDASLVAGLTASLAPHQPIFARTGGSHAAALCAANGQVLVVREDIGRHNALDKAIGWYHGPLGPKVGASIAVLSSRISAELVQKANRAAIPLVVAVSAPSSLAIELAAAAGMTLVGFARRGGFNVYCGHSRLHALAREQT